MRGDRPTQIVGSLGMRIFSLLLAGWLALGPRGEHIILYIPFYSVNCARERGVIHHSLRASDDEWLGRVPHCSNSVDRVKGEAVKVTYVHTVSLSCSKRIFVLSLEANEKIQC